MDKEIVMDVEFNDETTTSTTNIFNWRDVLNKGLDLVGGIFSQSSNNKSAAAIATQRAKTQRTIIISIGGLAIGLLVFFGLRRK